MAEFKYATSQLDKALPPDKRGKDISLYNIDNNKGVKKENSINNNLYNNKEQKSKLKDVIKAHTINKQKKSDQGQKSGTSKVSKDELPARPIADTADNDNLPYNPYDEKDRRDFSIKAYKREHPVKCTVEIIRAIYDELQEGKTLRQICRRVDRPNYTAVLNFIKAHNELQAEYYQARKSGADAIADEVADVGRAANDPRVKVDSLKWFASMLNPDRYSDKRQIALSGGIGIGGFLPEPTESELNEVLSAFDFLADVAAAELTAGRPDNTLIDDISKDNPK